MSDKFAIVSDVIPQICDALKKRNYKLIYTDCVDEFISYEQKHADMQSLLINDQIFVLKECTELIKNIADKTDFKIIKTQRNISGEYPENIQLNAKIVGKNLIGKLNSIDKNVLNFCKNNGYNLIDVKQGYAACSCLKVDENSVITTDNSIYKALKNSNIDTLKISNENIVLHGAKRGECGFIGGASVNLGDEMLFFGDITSHPDFKKIHDFCNNRDIKISYIKNLPLVDIGGVVLLNN